MNTSDTMTQTAGRLYDYDVTDSSGNKIGSVDGVWVDDATNKPEFFAVKTGWLFGKSHLVPIQNAQIDDASRTIQIPYGSDQVKNGPSFATDAEISPSDEQEIYDYYGMERSTAPSPTGYAAGGTGPSETATSGAATGQADTIPSQATEVEVPTVEEDLAVGKRPVQAGQVRLRKVVRTEQEEIPVELRREEVDIERVPAGESTQIPSDAFQEREIDVPVMEEQPVVGKEARVTGQVRVGKDVQTEQRTVGGEVRKTDVEIDEEGDTGIEGEPNNPAS